MFYFESIKIQAPNLKTPYALTLKLNDKKLYFLTCDNDKWLQNIFNFTKNKQNYESGGWIIDDYDLIHLSNSQFNNFCYQKLSYCDESTIINPNFTVNKLIKIYASFFHLEKSFINDLLKKINFSNDLTNKKIKQLTKIEQEKLKICLACSKASEYIICNLLKNIFVQSEVDEISNFLNYVSKQYNKTIICFVNSKTNFENLIFLDSKEFLTFNKLMTISTEKYLKPGYKLVKNKFSIYINLFKQINWEWFGLFVINLVLVALSIWIMNVPKISDTGNNQQLKQIVDFANQEVVIWNIIIYSLYFVTYINNLVWWKIMHKKRKAYLNFLDNIHIDAINKAVVWPVVYFLIIIMSTIIGFVAVDISFTTTKLIVNSLWFALPLFLYIIYIVALILGLALQINQTIRPNTFKQTFIDIITN